jgi:Flp pilus assembly pilin Flp
MNILSLIKTIKTFKSDESGAVTVDWVVLTAAIVGIGIAVLGSLSSGIDGLTDAINADLTGTTVGEAATAISATN